VLKRGLCAVSALVSLLLTSSPVLAATAPPLGSTNTYGLVSSTTTVTTSTTVNGNVCYTTAPVTPLSIFSGTILVPCGSQIADQSAALANINGQPCVSLGVGVVALEAVVVGLNPPGTFPPGCYVSGGAMNITLNTSVTLLGAGVFIFRSGAAMTTGAGASIVLNGPTANDVFWAPTSTTTLGAGTAFVGTIIDDAGIILGAGSTLSGRALAAGGTVTTNSSTITSPTLPTPAPVSAPTLAEWGMITFAFLILGVGMYQQRRRQI
jgi:type VI secretion system secreted protein VgrG